MQEVDMSIKMLIGMLVQAINRGKVQRKNAELYREISSLKGQLLTEKNQTEEYNRCLFNTKENCSRQNARIREQKALIDKFKREVPELERIIEWHGQQEVTLRMEISDLKDRLQESEYERKNLLKSLSDERLQTA